MGKRSELAEHLKDVAETTLNQSEGSEALCERALLNEYGVGDLPSALEDLQELRTRAPDEPLWAWSSFRIAARSGDWSEAVLLLEKLRELCPKTAPRLDLLAADLSLFALGNPAAAASLYSAAVGGLEGEAERETARAGASLCASFGDRLFPESTDRVKGDFAAHERLAMELWGESGRGEEVAAPHHRLMWDVMSPSRSASRASDYRRLGELFEGRSAEACMAAGVLWDDDPEQEVVSGGACSVMERLAEQRGAYREDIPPETEGELGDEGVDLLLDQVDLLAGEGKTEEARGIISMLLTRVPDHPGVLEAYARLAGMTDQTADLVDAHGRLAGFYSAKGEKAANLARAASLMFDELKDVKGAERIAREAVKREPNHEEAHRVLTAVLTERGDEGALVKQIEDRIDAEKDKDALVELYEEQVDRLFAVDDTTGALEAVDKILDLKPDHLPAYRTRIDLLATREEYEEAVAAIMEFTFLCEDPAEKRSVIWRAAQIAANDMGDQRRGLQILEDLRQEGDSHPQTERLIAEMAGSVGEWEQSSDALGRLASLVSDPLKKASILQEQARVALEHLFEPERAEELVDKALELDPGSVESVKLSVQFRDEDASERVFGAACANLQARCSQTPLDETLVSSLKVICDLAGRSRLQGLCEEAIEVLRGVPPSASEIAADSPRNAMESGGFIAMVTHPQEAGCAAAEVARLAASVTSEAFKDRNDGPAIGKGTMVSKKAGDPVFEWVRPYVTVTGLEKFELHRAGRDSRGARPALCSVPGVVLDDALLSMPSASQRFFIARALWRSIAGLGAFEEGDTSTPVRWISALTAATLGADVKLPIPTDRDLVDLAASTLPRRVRKRLVEPCRRILETEPHEIRGWAAATSFSADRFGLLAAGTLHQVVMPVVEETAGPVGLRRYAENPLDALGKVPRCLELLRFVLSAKLVELEESVGLSRTGGE